MRPAAELRRLAYATGTFADYYGDGASVPWSIMIPPLNAVLFFYKIYLDRRWPDAFKLHDWLYTPYGALIQATKEEADDALEEEISVDSPRDGAIVGRAVRLGPAYWFGQSVTGFPNKPIHNMGVTNRGDSMPTKVVIQMKDVAGLTDPTKTRVAGFTEFVYHPSDSVAEVMAALKAPVLGLLPARAYLLPTTGTIYGVKLYQGGSGRGASAKLSYPGNPSWPTDVPQMALQLSARAATTGGVRNFHIHAVPDQFIIQGVYAPNAAFRDGLEIYKLALTAFGFYTKPLTNVRYNINTVVAIPPVAPATASQGLVTTIQPHSFVAGNQVTFFSTVLANGQKYTVTKTVVSVASALQFTVANWVGGNTTEGKVGSPLKVFDNFNSTTIEAGGIAALKVGRPSDLYRGKRSKRRQTV